MDVKSNPLIIARKFLKDQEENVRNGKKQKITLLNELCQKVAGFRLEYEEESLYLPSDNLTLWVVKVKLYHNLSLVNLAAVTHNSKQESKNISTVLIIDSILSIAIPEGGKV